MSVRFSQHESPLSPVTRCTMLTAPAPATATEIHPQGSEERTHATSLLGCAWVLIDPAGLCYPAVTLAGPPGACGHGTPSPAPPSPSAAPGSLQPLTTRVCPWLRAGWPPTARDKSLAFRTGAPPFNTAGFHLPAPKSVILVPHHLLGSLSAGSDAVPSTQRAHPRGAHRVPPHPQPTTKDPRRGEQSPLQHPLLAALTCSGAGCSAGNYAGWAEKPRPRSRPPPLPRRCPAEAAATASRYRRTSYRGPGVASPWRRPGCGCPCPWPPPPPLPALSITAGIYRRPAHGAVSRGGGVVTLGASPPPPQPAPGPLDGFLIVIHSVVGSLRGWGFPKVARDRLRNALVLQRHNLCVVL